MKDARVPETVPAANREKVLVIDDEPRVVRLVSEVLKMASYEVVSANNGETGLELLVLEQPNLLLLDVLMDRGPDGYEICRRVREFSDVPVIMLTAKAQDDDVLTGFDAGADDYLTKPFNAKELLARVKAVLRRSSRSEETVTSSMRCGEMEIDFARHLVRVRGQKVSLTRTEYELLRHLALNANRVMLQGDLLARVWGPEYRDDVDYLRAYIRYLRRKLEQDPAHPRYIVTEQGSGYMLVCPAD